MPMIDARDFPLYEFCSVNKDGGLRCGHRKCFQHLLIKKFRIICLIHSKSIQKMWGKSAWLQKTEYRIRCVLPAKFQQTANQILLFLNHKHSYFTIISD